MNDVILAVTPNPTLDVSGEVLEVIPNEKIYVKNENRNPGGGGINVARMLTRLNAPVVASGFFGGGTGDEIKELLDKESILNRLIRIKGHSRTSLTISNRHDHNQTRFSFPGPTVSSAEIDLLLRRVKQTKMKMLVVGGSLPVGMHAQDILNLCRAASCRSIPFVVDSRPKVLRKVLKAKPILIKPNLLEFQELVGTHAITKAGVYQKAQRLLKYCPFVCVSSVESGALLITRSGTYFGMVPRIEVKSTVGAGDSMVAAMIFQMIQNNFSGEDLLRWGLAASAATLQHSGTRLGSQEEIRTLYRITKIEKYR